MEAIRGVRLCKFKLRKIILGVRMHFRHTCPQYSASIDDRLIKLVPAVNHSLREEVQPYISVCAMSC